MHERIINDWKKKIFKPLYWFEGEESYFIDELIDYAEHHILPESEASFNLSIFYGKDAEWSQVLNACMRYPMFAEKQVVILKEAQHLKDKDIEKFETYFQKPLPSTIFVVGFKEKKLDGRSKLSKLVKKHEYYCSEKIKEYQLPEAAQKLVSKHGLTISPAALSLLTENIGNDLSRINNEIEKLTVNLSNRKNINELDIEIFIGISREFNVFELQDALSYKNLPKAIRIIQYFGANPKAAPIQFILPTLYAYFSKLYSIFGMKEDPRTAIKKIFFNISAQKSAEKAISIYKFNGLKKIILLLHQYNLKSLGVNSVSVADAELLKELTVKIMTC